MAQAPTSELMSKTVSLSLKLPHSKKPCFIIKSLLLAIVKVAKIISPTVLVLSRPLTEFENQSIHTFTHYYSVHKAETDIFASPRKTLNCPSVISLSALWKQDLPCLNLSSLDEFLITFTVTSEDINKPKIENLQIEIWADTEKVGMFLLGAKKDTESTLKLSYQKQSINRPLFPESHTHLYLAHFGNRLMLGGGLLIGDGLKFRAKLESRVTKVTFSCVNKVSILNLRLWKVDFTLHKALQFSKSLPTLMGRATFTEHATEEVDVCERGDGYNRSTTIVYTCSTSDSTYIKSIQEYERCIDTVVVATPALCPGASNIESNEVANVHCIQSNSPRAL